MRTLWVVCCLFAFGLASLAGCNPNSAPDSSGTTSAAKSDADKAKEKKDKKEKGKAAPGKSAKPHTTSVK
jgi:hypothetical protein